MKKLIFILIAIVLMAAALPVATGWLNYSGAKNFAMWTTKWLQADQVFYWQGDTIKKDSLVYTDFTSDSIGWRYIDGAVSWIRKREVSDEAYDQTSWDGVTKIAPSKNAIRDKFAAMEPVSYCATTMTVNRGTLVAGTVSDLCMAGGTDVQITELNGTDPLRVTFTFSGVVRMSDFVFYGTYNGGALHVVYVEIYNYSTSAWDYLGQFATATAKAWYSYPIYNSSAYISGGNVQVRINHQGNGVNTHNLYLDYVDVDFGGGGTSGATNLAYTASATNGIVTSDTGTDATIPAGSTTNASLMLPADKTKLNGIASGADNYGSWTLNGGGTPTTVPSGYTVNFYAGTGMSVNNSGLDLTYTNTAPMIYPGAGIPLSTGSAWGTSITDNSGNWNNSVWTLTTTGNSGSASKTGNTLNVPNYTLAGLGGITTAPTDQVHYRTASGWKAATLSSTLYTNYMTIHYTNDEYLQIDKATTSAIGLMSAADKTNLDAFTSNKSNYDAAYGNMGKVKLFGTSTYGELSASFFEWNTNSIQPIRDGSPQENSLYPITSGGVYTALQAKANLSGAAFTGAISSTSTMTATDFILSSDRNLKKDIQPLSVEWGNKIDFVSYRFKADTAQRIRYGVIAQEVEQYAPELVHTDAKGVKSVSYIDLLIVKNQHLQQQVNFLKYENMFAICLTCFLFIVAVFVRARRS
jgi:hypothetical protein